MVFILWTVAFSVKIIYISINLNIDIEDHQLLYSIYVIALNLISDIIPYISILESKFLELFKTTHNETQRESVNLLDTMAFDDENNYQEVQNAPLISHMA